MWFIGVEVEQETSAPLLKKILDPPLKFQTTFLGRYITTNFISAHVSCTTLLLASIHEKNENDVLHV